MKKILLGAIVGGVILFFWGFLAWTAIPLHDSSLHTIGNEAFVIDAMRTTIPTHGVYLFPAMPKNGDQAQQEDWERQYKQGPVGMVIYNPAGSDPMMPGQMVVGFFLGLFASLLVAWFLSRSTGMRSSYLARVCYCGLFGVLISINTHLVMWNWMNFPMDYTTAMIADSVIGWLLAGLGIAAVVKDSSITLATEPSAKSKMQMA